MKKTISGRNMKFNFRQQVLGRIRCLFFSFFKGVTFGKNVYIGSGCNISAIYKLEFGSDIYIGKRVTIEVEGRVGNGVIIANNVGVVGKKDHDIFHSNVSAFSANTVRNDRSLSLPVIIEDGVWIGYGSCILSGVTLGRNCVIAAGSVVIADVAPGMIVAGNPARVVSSRPV